MLLNPSVPVYLHVLDSRAMMPLPPERHREERVPWRTRYPYPIHPVVLVHATKGHVIEYDKQIAVGKFMKVAQPRKIARLMR